MTEFSPYNNLMRGIHTLSRGGVKPSILSPGNDRVKNQTTRNQGFKCSVQGSSPSDSVKCFSKLQISGPQPRVTELEFGVGVGPFSQVSRGF